MNTVNYAPMRRAALLEECGVGQVWLLRNNVSNDTQKAADISDVVEVREPQLVKDVVLDVATTSSPKKIPTQLSASSESASAWDIAPIVLKPSDPAEVAKMDWMQLQTAVAACNNCGLCQGRSNAVLGGGDQKARWLFIGDGPARSEDQLGQPFVGPAGKLLDNMLMAMGVSRADGVYVTNIVKCRPLDESGVERPPSVEEVAACLPYLQRQIALIQPTMLVALGKTAGLALLGMEVAAAGLRGKVHRYAGLPLIVTYHPADLLRQPANKAKAWNDLCLAMQTDVDLVSTVV